MPEEPPEKPLLDEWRQDDFALHDVELPIMGIDAEGAFFGGKAVPGVVVVSQSCDIVRAYGERPLVQVAALARATEAELAQIEARAKPRYGFLTPLKMHGLVVDFDIVASADKQLVATWERQAGCATDGEQRDFAAALARHKQRFAFPDAFQDALKPLRRWIERRAEKPNAAGGMLRSIEQIRVICDDWSKPERGLEFIGLLIGDPAAADRLTWAAPLAEMQKSVTGTYPEAVMRLATWSELSAAEYVRSDRLDLDGLSDA